MDNARITQSLNGEPLAKELELHDTGVPGKSNIHFGPKNTVHIIDALPIGDLKFHCKSKDTDLGMHDATADIFERTLFFCNFMHNQHRQSFDGFDSALEVSWIG
ncbi:unnamed protein product [Thlaspi arvense]|uniref:S-protein homolog n=1 Tax=Thlaspi arvense TaxID=13288 RepID=A0AAU9RX70_THLAR|nr:unnamed protein product [Thlaspi arvense]CAH2050184.1 unnamed protein product [Thlaspi arvense]